MLVDRVDSGIASLRGNIGGFRLHKPRNTSIGKAVSFRLAKQVGRQRGDRILTEVTGHVRKFLHFGEEPGIDMGKIDQLLHCEAFNQRLQQIGNAVGVGGDDLPANVALVENVGANHAARFKRTKALEERFLESASTRHHFAH